MRRAKAFTKGFRFNDEASAAPRLDVADMIKRAEKDAEERGRVITERSRPLSDAVAELARKWARIA